MSRIILNLMGIIFIILSFLILLLKAKETKKIIKEINQEKDRKIDYKNLLMLIFYDSLYISVVWIFTFDVNKINLNRLLNILSFLILLMYIYVSKCRKIFKKNFKNFIFINISESLKKLMIGNIKILKKINKIIRILFIILFILSLIIKLTIK